MKTHLKSIWLFSALILVSTFTIYAQPPGGRPSGPPPGGGPEEMVKREKQNLYEKITDLSDDQKLLLDGIYEEYTTTFKEKMQEAFQSRDREKMRSTMEALTAEKDSLIGDVLNEDQFTIYKELTVRRRDRKNSEDKDNEPTAKKEDDESQE